MPIREPVQVPSSVTHAAGGGLPRDVHELLNQLPWRTHTRYASAYGTHEDADLIIEPPHADDFWLIWKAYKHTLKERLGYRMTRTPNGDWVVTRSIDPRSSMPHDEAHKADQAFLDALDWRHEGRILHKDYGDSHEHITPLADTPGEGAVFWRLWNARKEDLIAAGYRVRKNDQDDSWSLHRYTAISGDELARAQRDLEQSRANDADIDLPTPPGYDLLPYQRAGIKYALERPRTLIADQMGLGKTIQALVAARASDGLPAIVIVPASLKLNWAREASVWLPEALSVILDGRPKPDIIQALDAGAPDKRLRKHISIPSRPAAEPSELLEALKHPQRLLILNYDIAEAWLPHLRGATHTLKSAILDELHYLKEPKAKRTKAVRSLVAGIPRAIGLTGTPILNRPKELLSQLEVLGVVKELFGTAWNYLQRYTDAYYNDFGWDFSGASNLDELQTILRSRVMVRRLKDDVLTELPAKRRQLIAIPPNKKIKKLLDEEREAHQRHERTIAAYKRDVARAKRLGDRAAYERAVSGLREARGVEFSEMSRIRRAVGVAKVPEVIEYLRTALEAGEKIIVFGHHKDVIAALRAGFDGSCVVIDGSTPVSDRQALVDRFQNDASVRLFIGNMRAAGVGITLTASSHVVFAESDWTPGVLAQAEDRSHRLGQRNSVLVTHIVWDGSLDAHMAQLVIEKQYIAEQALDTHTPSDALRAVHGVSGTLEVPSGDAPEPSVAQEEGPSVAALRAEAQRARAQLMNRGVPTAAWQRTPEQQREHVESLIARRTSNGEQRRLTPQQRKALHDCLRFIAGNDDDYASIQNGVGFNKADASIGHHLANLPHLEPHHDTIAQQLATTYRNQLPPHLRTHTMLERERRASDAADECNSVTSSGDTVLFQAGVRSADTR